MRPEIGKAVQSWRLLVRRIRRGGDLVALTAVTGMVLQVSRPLASLLTIPFLLDKLGSAGLGVWMIALSLMGLMSTLNSGLSIALVTRASRANDDASAEATESLSVTATIIALITAALLMTVCLPPVLLIDWTTLLALESAAQGWEVKELLVALIAIMALGFVAAVPKQIMLGRLHGFVSHAIDIVAVVVGAIALIVGLLLDFPLWALAVVFMGPAPVMGILGGVAYLRHQRIRYFVPSRFRRDVFRSLGEDSYKMVGYHAAYSVSSQTDIFLIGALVGAQASAIYGVAQRIFSLPIMFALAVTNAQWPALAKADAAGDYAKFDQILRSTLRALAAFGFAIGLAIALAYPNILLLWLGRDLNTDIMLIVGQAIWIPLAIIVTLYDISFRARDETGFLAKHMIMMAVVNIVCSLALVQTIGYAGAIWGTIIGYAAVLLIPYLYRHKQLCAARHIPKESL